MRRYAVAAIVIAVTPTGARAECVIHSPSAMYLGDNAPYTVLVNVKRGEACIINFKSQSPEVSFKSVSVPAPPKYGAISKAGDFEYLFKPAAQGSSDQFKLKLCGKDTHGAGCNMLTYSVSVTE